MTMSYVNCDDLNISCNPAAKPALFSRLASFPVKAVGALIKLKRNYKRRKLFTALLNYNDHMLEDMGLTRYLVEEGRKLSLKDNAAIISRKWARQE